MQEAGSRWKIPLSQVGLAALCTPRAPAAQPLSRKTRVGDVPVLRRHLDTGGAARAAPPGGMGQPGMILPLLESLHHPFGEAKATPSLILPPPPAFLSLLAPDIPHAGGCRNAVSGPRSVRPGSCPPVTSEPHGTGSAHHFLHSLLSSRRLPFTPFQERSFPSAPRSHGAVRLCRNHSARPTVLRPRDRY